MQMVMDFFLWIQGLGSTLFVPLIIFVTGLCFGLTVLKAGRSAVTVGVGFIGVDLTLSIIWNVLGPITEVIVQRFGFKLDVLDVSWPAAAAVSFTSRIGAFIIPYILLINVVMLLLRLTKTVNIDIWNYWHFAISGALTTSITGSVFLGFLEAACHLVIVLKFADITAKQVQKELNIPGISIPHANSIALVPLYLVLDKLYDRIPFLCKGPMDSEKMHQNKLLRFFTEPLMMSFIIGFILGLLAGVDLVECARTAMYMAALILLLPRAVKVIMEGLIPISQATKKFMDKRFHGHEVYIGLDSAVILGHPTTLAVSMLLIPITLVLAFIIPANSTIPAGDLAAISFFIAVATPVHKGNFLRTLFSGIATMSIMLIICSAFAPAYTRIARGTAGITIPSGNSLISSMAIGDPLAWVLSKLLSIEFVGAVLCLVVTAGVVTLCKYYEKRQDTAEAQHQEAVQVK